MPVRAGDYILGVRASTPELGALVEEAFRSRLVPEARPPANFSLFLPPTGNGKTRPFQWLFEGYARRLRTTSMRRLLDALWHRLDGYDARAFGSSVLLASTVLIRDGEAHLLPGAARSRALFKERAWEQQGFTLIDRPWVALDTSTGTITVPPSGLTWNGRLEDRLRAVAEEERLNTAQPVGAFPIATWTVGSQEASLAARTVRAADDLLDRGDHGPELVGRLAQLLLGVERLDLLRTGKLL